MKKSKKIFLRVLPVLIVCVMMFTCASTTILAATSSNEPIGTDFSNLKGNQSGSTTMNNAVQKMWASVLLILQIAAVAAIVFAGVRYMFASADQKADIKKQMIILVVGAILVFAASTIVSIIVNVTKEIASNS